MECRDFRHIKGYFPVPLPTIPNSMSSFQRLSGRLKAKTLKVDGSSSRVQEFLEQRDLEISSRDPERKAEKDFEKVSKEEIPTSQEGERSMDPI